MATESKQTALDEKKLRKIKKVGIAGAGGIGSHLIYLLFDYGVNRNQFPFTDWEIQAFDDDTVDMKNLLHQRYEEGDIGKYKVDCMAERCAITPVKRFMTPDDFGKFDLIFSCVDDMVFRKSLYNWGFNNPGKAFWIDGRCESRTVAVFNSSMSREKLEKYINDKTERAGCLLAYEKENNISHVAPVIVASLMCQKFLNWYRGEDKQIEVLTRV